MDLETPDSQGLQRTNFVLANCGVAPGESGPAMVWAWNGLSDFGFLFKGLLSQFGSWAIPKLSICK